VQRPQRLLAENNRVPYRLLDLSGYVQEGGIFGNDLGTFMIGTGQGCIKPCTYCFWRNFVPSLLRPEAIVDLVEGLYTRYGVPQYHLTELDFFTNLGRALAVARAWKERLPHCTWFALVSPEDTVKFSDEELDLLYEGGCRKLELGTESASAGLLRVLGKGHSTDDILPLTERLTSRGIHVLHNIIFGFPGETAADRKESTRRVRALHRMDPKRNTFAFRLFEPVPNTPLGDEALALVADFPETIEGVLEFRQCYSDERMRTMPWIDAEQERLVKRMVFYTLPIATSCLPLDGAVSRALYQGLRRFAWFRLENDFWAGRFDERLYTRFLGDRLSETFRF